MERSRKPIIRGARLGDAGSIAYLTYLSAQGHVRVSLYDVIFPGTPGPTRERLELLEELFAADTISFAHHSVYMVAEVGGRVASSLYACNGSVWSTGFHEALREIGWEDSDLEALDKRTEPLRRVRPSIPVDSWIVGNVVTLPEYRRRGLTDELLKRAIDKGRRQGYKSAQLTVFTGNTPAQEAYEKAGFKVTDTYTNSQFEEIFGCRGQHLMVRKLQRHDNV